MAFIDKRKHGEEEEDNTSSHPAKKKEKGTSKEKKRILDALKEHAKELRWLLEGKTESFVGREIFNGEDDD